MEPTQYRDYIFPVLADVMGWVMSASTLVPFVVWQSFKPSKTKEALKTCSNQQQIGDRKRLTADAWKELNQ